jgi:hypothetical protein
MACKFGHLIIYQKLGMSQKSDIVVSIALDDSKQIN